VFLSPRVAVAAVMVRGRARAHALTHYNSPDYDRAITPLASVGGVKRRLLALPDDGNNCTVCSGILGVKVVSKRPSQGILDVLRCQIRGRSS